MVSVGKRKQKVVMLEMKLKVIKQHEKNKSQRVVAQATINDTWKDREKINKRLASCGNLWNDAA